MTAIASPAFGGSGSPWEVALWGAWAGVASMLLYRRTSPQQLLRALDVESLAVKHLLQRHEGELSEALALVRQSLALAWRRVRVAAGPSLLACLPVAAAWSVAVHGQWTPESMPSVPDWLRWHAAWFVAGSTAAALTAKFSLGIK
jgi:hypothetical protein